MLPVLSLKNMFDEEEVNVVRNNLLKMDFHLDDGIIGYMALVLTCRGQQLGLSVLKSGMENRISPLFPLLHSIASEVNLSEKLDPEDDSVRNLLTLTHIFSDVLWEKDSKVIYKVDPSFISALSTSDELRIYPLDLMCLPYHTFYLDFSEVEVAARNGLDGIHVTAIGPRLTGRNGVMINMCYMFNKSAVAIPVLVNIPLRDCEYENGVLYYDKYKGENPEPLDTYAEGSNSANKETLSDMEMIHLMALNMLEYITSKKPDIQESKVTKRQKARAARLKQKDKVVTEYEVGVRYGKAISLYTDKVKREYEESLSRGKGSPHKPHLVRAHWHGYWTGPGRTEFQYIWVAPYFQGKGEIDVVIHDCVEVDKTQYSQGEELLYYLLEKAGIDFIRQKYIPETGKYFDCAAYINGQPVFIEFDGQQHFKPVKNWDYKKTVQSDDEKNGFCRRSNIPLCRIRYDQKLIIDDVVRDVIACPNKYLERMNPFLTDEEYYSIRK